MTSEALRKSWTADGISQADQDAMLPFVHCLDSNEADAIGRGDTEGAKAAHALALKSEPRRRRAFIAYPIRRDAYRLRRLRPRSRQASVRRVARPRAAHRR